MNVRKGITLQELLAVVIILSILVSIAVVQHGKAVTKARIDEVESNLSLMHAAQKIYHAENGSYYAADNIDLINQTLGLDLEESYWDYVTVGGAGPVVGLAGYPDFGSVDFYYDIDEDGNISCVAVAGSCP